MSFDELRTLKDKAQRQALGFYLAEGEHLCLELGKALARRPALLTSRILVSHEYLAGGRNEGLIRQCCVELMRAVHHLHDKGIVHGSLKRKSHLYICMHV